MSMTIHVDIVSADAEVYSGTASMVFVPAIMGEIGIAPRHTPLITRIKPGEVRIQKDGEEEKAFYVSGGMLEIQPHVVTVLADTAQRASDIDQAAALEAKERAERAMSDSESDFEYAKAKAELAQSVAQLRAIKKIRKGKN